MRQSIMNITIMVKVNKLESETGVPKHHFLSMPSSDNEFITLMYSIISILRSESGLSFVNFLWLCLFGILTMISVQSHILEIAEQNLAYHMIIEHTLFFLLGVALEKLQKYYCAYLCRMHITKQEDSPCNEDKQYYCCRRRVL